MAPISSGKGPGSGPHERFPAERVIADATGGMIPRDGDILIRRGGRWVFAAAPEGEGGGEIITASNLGAGAGVFAAKVASDLQFKSLVEGSNITITESDEEIEIAAAGGGSGEANTGSNVGFGAEVFKEKVGVDLRFRTLVGDSSITITEGVDEIEISAGAVSGGGSSFDVYDPDKPQASPSSLDDDFDSTTLNPKYTAINTGANFAYDVHTTRPKALFMRWTPQASHVFRGFLDTLPAGDGAYQARFVGSALIEDYRYMGLVLSSGNTAGAGSQIFFGIICVSNAWKLYIQTYTNFINFVATQYLDDVWGNPEIVLRAARTGTSWDLMWGLDGRTWSKYTITEATLGWTPGYIGPMLGGSASTTGFIEAAVMHVRYNSDETTLFGGLRSILLV